MPYSGGVEKIPIVAYYCQVIEGGLARIFPRAALPTQANGASGKEET